MATIVLQQEFHRPVGIDDVRQLMQSSERRRAVNGVTALRHYLASDGRRLVGLFDAPDAEAVRRAMGLGDQGRSQSIWAATVHALPESDGKSPSSEARLRSLVVVERSYAAPTPFHEILPSADLLRMCFDLRDVKHIRSYYAQNQMRMVCLYDAPDTETVRTANRNAGMPFDLAWRATEIMEYEPTAPAIVG